MFACFKTLFFHIYFPTETLMYSLLIKRQNFWGANTPFTHCFFLCVCVCVFSVLVSICLCSPEAGKQHHGAEVRSSREGRALQPRKSPQREAAERGAATLRLLFAEEGSASRIFCARGLRPCRTTDTSASCTVKKKSKDIAATSRLQHLFFPSRYVAVKCWCGRTQRDCAYEE